jgi:hypothetical protein
MPPIPDDGAPAPPPSDPSAIPRFEPVVSPPPPPAGMPPLPGGVPPLPPTSDESGPPQSAVDLLAEYRRTSKPRGAGIKETFTRALGAAKKRGLALKLGHEVKSLQMAIDTQLETLGTLTLTHRPPVVGMSGGVAELSQIQEELSRREITLESLRGTKGGGSAVKELNREASQLRDRQRAVMVAIGRATWAARPEMPGAAGVYAALDRLQSSAGARQAELKVVEDAIGPLWNAEATRFGTLKKAAIIAGVVGGGLIVLYLLWALLASTLFATGLPSWVRYYVPRDTLAVVYFNMDSFRKTQVFEKLEGLIPSRSEIKRSNDLLQLCPEDVRDVFCFAQEEGPLVVLRTHEDLSLAQIAPKGDRDSRPERYKGYEYYKYTRRGNEYCAKTGACTYCFAPSEDSMERMLKRLDRKESPRLDKDLQSAVESVAGNDCYVAVAVSALTGERGPLYGMPSRLGRLAERVNYMAAYASFGSSVRFQYLLAFDKQSDADDCKEVLDSANEDREKLDDVLENLPFYIRMVAAKLAKRCSEATTVTRKGCLVYSRTDLKMDDVEDLIDEFKKLQRPMQKPRAEPMNQFHGLRPFEPN